jgi:hypothetical protein
MTTQNSSSGGVRGHSSVASIVRRLRRARNRRTTVPEQRLTAYLRSSKASGFTLALRFSFRARWCAPVLGCAEGSLIGSFGEALSDTGGTSSTGVREFRRRDSGRPIWCWDGYGLGYRNLASRAKRRGGCNKEGRIEVHTARKEAARILGAHSHGRILPECREVLVVDPTSRPICFQKRDHVCATEVHTNRPPSRRNRPRRGR